MNSDMPRAVPNRTRTLRRWMFGTGLTGLLFIGFTILFYAWENFRAERAWQEFKGDLMAQGQRFDPDAFNLPPVPDAQNFLKAPLIADWFAFYRLAPGTFPTGNVIRITRPGDVDLLGAWSECRPTDLKEWRDYFRRDRSKPADAATIDFQRPEVGRSVTDSTNATPPVVNAPDELVPLIVIDEVPLEYALRNLTRQAQVDVYFDPSIFEMALQGTPLMEVPVSIRFDNVTVRDALKAVLENYGLALVKTPTPGRFQITRALAPAPVWPNEAVDLTTVSLPPDADQLVPAIVINEIPASDAVRNVARQAGINFQFDPEVLHQTLPASYSLQLTNVKPRDALRRVLEENGLAMKGIGVSGVFVIVPARHVMPAAPLHSAREVLESFSPFADEFRALYAACERPQSRMEVDYRPLFNRPPPAFNFVGYRQVAPALALHASAQLSLSNTAAALQDATALFRLANTLSGQPNLISAMMQVSLTGLYLQVVWEGLAGRRWDDGQLRMLEAQLASIDLLTDCFVGFEGEQAAKNWWLEQTPQRELAGQFTEQTTGYKLPGRAKPMWAEPVQWAMRWGPRGWIRQIQIGYTETFQYYLGQLDLRPQRVLPSNRPTSSAQWNVPRDILSPIAAVVRRYGLYYVNAVQVTARHQTGINQARIACALERYRLVHGDFPDRLAQLAPQFIEQLPRDIMNGRPLRYRRAEDGQFVLYSVGWDQEDDAASGADWVWRYPAKPDAGNEPAENQ